METLILAIATMCQMNAFSTGYMTPVDTVILQRRCVAQTLRCIGDKTDKQEVAACIDPDKAWRVDNKCNEATYSRIGCRAEGCCHMDDCSKTKYCQPKD
jgi:hypothetical protein